MALTSMPGIAAEIAAAAWQRAATGVRTVQRALGRRSDAWLYGLDQEYPEYDAYHRRPRRLARAVDAAADAAETIAAVAAEGVAAVTLALRAVPRRTVPVRAVPLRSAPRRSLLLRGANRWAQRPASDRQPATSRRDSADRGPTGRRKRVRLGGAVGPAHRARRGSPSRVAIIAPRADSWHSLRSDVSDPPESAADRDGLEAERAAVAGLAMNSAPSGVGTPDTRQTSAIPSTFAPGAA